MALYPELGQLNLVMRGSPPPSRSPSPEAGQPPRRPNNYDAEPVVQRPSSLPQRPRVVPPSSATTPTRLLATPPSPPPRAMGLRSRSRSPLTPPPPRIRSVVRATQNFRPFGGALRFHPAGQQQRAADNNDNVLPSAQPNNLTDNSNRWQLLRKVFPTMTARRPVS